MRSMILNAPYPVRLGVLILSVVLTLGIVNYSIVSKERILANGTTVLLRLAPRDPRSLLQGDYMALRYAMADKVAEAAEQKQLSDGFIVLDLALNGEASFVEIYEGQELAEDEQILEFRKRGDSVRLASDAYFFEEGEWKSYQDAAFGELKVSSNGKGVLTGLRDGQSNRLEALD